MPPRCFSPEEINRGWDQPLHVGVTVHYSANAGVSLALFFPRPGCFIPLIWKSSGRDHKFVRTYDHASMGHFLQWLEPDDEVTFFHKELNHSLLMTKLHETSTFSAIQRLWSATWSYETDQSELALDLYDNVFAGELSLVARCLGGDMRGKEAASFELMRHSEYLALPQPRPEVVSISLDDGAGPVIWSDHEESESEKSESEKSASEKSESEAGESEAGESDGGSDFNFPSNASTADMFKGRVKTGTLFGHSGDTLGDWDVYVRFDAGQPGRQLGAVSLRRGNFVATPATAKAVLVRILGGYKRGGNRSISPAQRCYVCLLYCLTTNNWMHATMPNVALLDGDAIEDAFMDTLDELLNSFTPLSVSAAISQASRSNAAKRPRDGE